MKRSQGTSLATIKTKNEALRLLNTYNPSEQSRFAKYPERCVMGTAPTLAEVRKDYGVGVVMDWLKIELNDYQNFVGVKEDNKMALDSVEELCQMIVNRYYYLKLSEFMLFLNKMKYGDYGEVYGTIDPVRILRSLRSFVDDRNTIIDRVEQRRREEEDERSRKNAVTYEEYLKMKKK